VFLHLSVHKYTWNSPDGKKEIEHDLTDRRWNPSTVEVQYLRGADCDIDHYLVVAEVRHCQ